MRWLSLFLLGTTTIHVSALTHNTGESGQHTSNFGIFRICPSYVLVVFKVFVDNPRLVSPSPSKLAPTRMLGSYSKICVDDNARLVSLSPSETYISSLSCAPEKSFDSHSFDAQESSLVGQSE